VSARFLDAGGRQIGVDVQARVNYDVTPPPPPSARARQAEPVIVCRPGGPRVAGARSARAPYDLDFYAGEAGTSVQITERRLSPGGKRAAGPAVRTTGRPGGALWVRAVALAWAATGLGAAHRARLQPGGSALVWTAYQGQGIGLNWVHATTDLNERLRLGLVGAYRAGVAEALAYSIVDRTASGQRFRLNENLFRDPDDPVVVRWRDGMGTALLLATLVPALSADAPAHERRRARDAAAGYLAAFSVDHRHGGVLWRDSGRGEWFLEYTHRPHARVLNGFMQAVVSLRRFERQAARMAGSDPAWEPLGAEAHERVLGGAAAIHRWLPAFDLGGGATRYALGGGPAAPAYRRYHAELLRLLVRIPYLPPGWTERFERYRVRWGGGAPPREAATPLAPPPS
jgi:hypothetical protein